MSKVRLPRISVPKSIKTAREWGDFVSVLLDAESLNRLAMALAEDRCDTFEDAITEAVVNEEQRTMESCS